MSHHIAPFPELTDHDRRLLLNALFIAAGKFGACKVDPEDKAFWHKDYNALAAKLGYPGDPWNNAETQAPCAHGCRPAFLEGGRAESCWKCEVSALQEKLAAAVRDREHWTLQYVEQKDARERNLARAEQLQAKLEIAEKSLQARFFEGVRAGIRKFAWWKDGVQQVGTCGTTLEKALAEVAADEAAGRMTC